MLPITDLLGLVELFSAVLQQIYFCIRKKLSIGNFCWIICFYCHNFIDCQSIL